VVGELLQLGDGGQRRCRNDADGGTLTGRSHPATAQCRNIVSSHLVRRRRECIEIAAGRRLDHVDVVLLSHPTLAHDRERLRVEWIECIAKIIPPAQLVV
jgi:hypothetical protein